jgi:hypothetical protein
MTATFALINISTVVATIIALAACAPVHATPSAVFTGFINETGWSSSGFAFLLGLLQVWLRSFRTRVKSTSLTPIILRHVQSSFTIIGYVSLGTLLEDQHTLLLRSLPASYRTLRLTFVKKPTTLVAWRPLRWSGASALSALSGSYTSLLCCSQSPTSTRSSLRRFRSSRSSP